MKIPSCPNTNIIATGKELTNDKGQGLKSKLKSLSYDDAEKIALDTLKEWNGYSYTSILEIIERIKNRLNDCCYANS